LRKILTLSLCVASFMYAQNIKKNHEIAIYDGFDLSSKFEDSYVYGIKFNKYLNNNIFLSADYLGGNNIDYKNNSNTTNLRRYGVGIGYELDTNLVSTYIGASLGQEELSYKVDYEDSLYLKTNFGVKYFLTNNINLFGELANYYKFDTQDNNFLVSGGIGYVFGEKKSKIEEKPKVEKLRLIGTRVEEVVEPTLEAQEVQVQETQSTKTLKVEIEKIKTVDIYFDYKQSNVKTKYNEQIEKLIKVLKHYKNAKVELVGNTDNTGGIKYNNKLGLKRAEAILQVLVNNNISKDRISVKSNGELNPMYPNNPEESKAKNRRVDINILY
jgi:outer membrane protein OmpA-like peptidoglycan-associated protein